MSSSNLGFRRADAWPPEAEAELRRLRSSARCRRPIYVRTITGGNTTGGGFGSGRCHSVDVVRMCTGMDAATHAQSEAD